MIPKQIIPGASNGIASTFESGQYNDATYLAYGASNTVVILAIGSLKVLQVLGGHGDHEVKCLEWSRVGGKIAAGSDNKVVIYAPISNSKQVNSEQVPRWEAVLTLTHDFEVNALSWLPSRDFLISSGSSIQIWEFTTDLSVAHQTFLSSSTFSSSQLSGVQTKASRLEYEAQRVKAEEKRQRGLVRSVWKTQCTAPVAHLACSPDGRFFATAGKFDKVVKVWFAIPHCKPLPSSLPSSPPPASSSSDVGSNKAASPLIGSDSESGKLNGKSFSPASSSDHVLSDRDAASDNEGKDEPVESISFGFIYLPHARSVVSIAWRPIKDIPNPKRGWFFQNVLLTQSRDHVVRLWLESLNHKRQQFHMCSVISAGSDSVVSWLSSLSPFEGTIADPFAPVSNDDDDILDDSHEHVHTSNNCTHNGIARYSKLALSSKLRTAVDWIMGVQRDGTVVIWKLKDVDSHTRQTPALSKWNSMQQVLPLPEVSPNKILAFYDLRAGTVVKDNVRVPIEVSLYVYSIRGAISCWTFSIHGAANQLMSSTLSARCYGHRGLVKEIGASPRVPLVSTIDVSNNLILWQSADTTTVDPPFLLMDVSAMTPVQIVAWSPEGNVCFLSNGEGIFAYEMSLTTDDQPSTLPTRLPITMLEGSADIGNIIFIGAIIDHSAPPAPLSRVASNASDVPVSANASRKRRRDYCLVVVAATAERVFAWRIHMSTFYSPPPERPSSPVSPIPHNTSSSSLASSSDSVTVEILAGGTETTLTSTLLTEFQVAPYQKITCAAMVADGLHQQNEIAARASPYIPLVLTGGEDGEVRLFCLSENDQAPTRFRQMTSFKAYEGKRVSNIKCAYFGRIATATPGVAEVCIWELESATPSYKLEQKLVLSNTPQPHEAPELHFDWLPLANGKYVIGVGFGKELKIYGPQRPTSLQSFKSDWVVTDSFTSLPQPVCGLSWGRDAGLIVASASVLYVFTKWRDTQESQAGEKLDEAWITTYHRNSDYRSLPLYHPKILLEFLMAGHFERVGFILGKVLQTVAGPETERDEGDEGDEEESAPKPRQGELIIPPIMLSDICGLRKGLAAGTLQEEASKRKLIDDDGLDAPEIREDEILDEEAKATEHQSGFGAKQAKKLAEYLTSVVLPGVTGPEQMYLLAIIDTYKQMRETRGAIDERGVRFLLAVKIYAFMRRSLTGASNATQLQSHDFIWALHSDSQETLLQSCVPNDAEWPALKALGVGFWVTNPTTLRQIIEKVAQAAFKARKDPADCALYYLALKKKGALSVAYKSVKDQKLVDFLANDFTQLRWQTAATKNAYQLQGKHRYELAAAFFLLAGSLKDAVTVLIHRLYEGDHGPTYNYILESLILPAALKSNDYPMASIAKWLLKHESLTVLQQVTESNATSQAEQQNPSILNFFKFLSGHTLLRNCPAENKKQDVLLRKAAYSYIQANVDFLALEQLEELKKIHPTIDVDELDEDEEPSNTAEKEEEKEKETEEPKEEEKESDDLGLGLGGGGGGGYDPYGGYSTSFGGFGGSSSGGGGGGGDDWLDELGGGSSSSNTTSSYSFSTGGGPSFLGGADEEEKKEDEKKPKEPTKKYLHSTYPAVDTALMFHVVVQVLVEHIERARKLGLWKAEASFMYANLQTLSNKSGIAVNDIVLELLRYCVARQYIQQAWDMLLEYPEVPSQHLLFFASQRCAPHRKHMALLFGAANDIIGVAGHITTHSLAAAQARHISTLAIEMFECVASVTESIPPEEFSLIYSAIYLAEFISAWVLEEIPVLESLIKITNIKDATEAFKAGHKVLEQAEYEEHEEDDDDKPQNEPANILWLTQLLRLLVLKKFESNIEEFLSVLQASRAPSSVKLVQHLVRWLRVQQGKLGHIPRNLQKIQFPVALSLLQGFADLVRTGHYHTHTIQLWSHISKIEVANDYAFALFTVDEKTHDVMLEYKVTFEPEVTIYKDHDILQSFCINAADNQYVAVATTKGIREIDLRQVHVDGAEGNEEDTDGPQGNGEEYTSSSTSLRQSTDGLKRSNVTSKSTASLPSFKSKQGILKMAMNTLAPSKELDHNIIVQWVESHPHDPYYLSGGIDGSVCLWQFGVPEALAAYRLPPHPWVMRCRFNPSGTKFGACDMAGNLELWKFNAPEDALRPFHNMQAHTKSTLDFAFLNNGSFIATVGISQESKRNVCLWDVLQPPHKAMVSAFTDHEAGATSVVYSPRHQLLVSGGKKGGIYVFDIRQNKLMESFKAHTLNTKSLSMDGLEQFAVSGASDGNIKVWDLATLNCREVWEDVHRKQTFVRPTGVFKSPSGVFQSPVSTYGVMAVGVVGEHIYSCGADKRLIKRKFTYGTL